MEISMKASRSFMIAIAVLTGIGLASGVRAQSTHANSDHEAQVGAAAMPGHDASGSRSEMARMMQHGPGMMDKDDKMMQMHGKMMEMHAKHAAQMAGGAPTMAGQDAFGVVQEIVRKLDADPNTDWSKVNLEALRQHLIDMNEVTLNAGATAKPIDGGLEIAVTGSGRTLAAIQRMVPAHAQEINGSNGWSAKSELLADGVLLKVTSTDPKQVRHIRGLGFIGILVSGSHHQPHHLAIAKGEFPHVH
jgi:hypothetical protein